MAAPEAFDLAASAGMDANAVAALIELHNRKYWVDGEAEISDSDYDALVRRLEELDPKHPLLAQVNAPAVAGSGKIAHAKPMLSLDKAYRFEDLLAWAKGCARRPGEEFLIQPKYDGISAYWSGSVLATRGDGFLGEDITDKLPLLLLESKDAPPKTKLSAWKRPVRGEIVIREDDFQNLYSRVLNRNGRPYKNSRNAVAGMMGLKEIDAMLAQGAVMTLVDYDLHTWRTTFDSLKQDWQPTIEAIEALPYPMDGVVIKLADSEYAESLGNTAHHPRGQIAFKFSGVRKNAKLLDVEWSFGKNCLTPVALLEAVEIGGVTIKHASLHNLQNILDKDLHIGDVVEVERAGDVIPYVIKLVEPGAGRKSCLIERCPSCGSALVRDLPELRCVNPDCFETRLQRLLAAVKSVGIERLGEPTLRKMMTTLGVKTLKDVFALSVLDLLKLEGFKGKSASKLHEELQAARDAKDYLLLASLNIRGVGPNIAKAILRERTLSELREMDVDALKNCEGVGPERAAAIQTALKEGAAELDALLSCVRLVQTKGSDGGGSGPSICFTGKMPEKRAHYETLAKEAGFTPVDAVVSGLSILVAADPSGGSAKLEKARKAGTKVMSLDEWLASLKEGPSASQISATEKAEAKVEPVKNEATSGETHEQPDLFLGF